jgi:excisionase family DNA binding protein
VTPPRPRRPRPAQPGSPAPAAASSPALPGAGKADPPAERLAYSVDEAARLTGLSRDLLYDEMRRGNLTYIKIGRRRLITRYHLQQFLGVAP